MRNKVKYMAAALIAAIMMTGCVPNKETAIQRDPDFGEAENIDLSINQLHNDTLEAFGDTDNNPYIYITDVSVDGDPKSNSLVINASCLKDATDEDIKQFAAAAVRHVGEAMTIQLPQYVSGDQESFGTVWQDYSLKIEIKNEGDNAVRLSMEVPAGGTIELDPDIETYEEEWIEQRDNMLSN